MDVCGRVIDQSSLYVIARTGRYIESPFEKPTQYDTPICSHKTKHSDTRYWCCISPNDHIDIRQCTSSSNAFHRDNFDIGVLTRVQRAGGGGVGGLHKREKGMCVCIPVM